MEWPPSLRDLSFLLPLPWTSQARPPLYAAVFIKWGGRCEILALMCKGSEAWAAPGSRLLPHRPHPPAPRGDKYFQAEVFSGTHSRWRHCTTRRLGTTPPASALQIQAGVLGRGLWCLWVGTRIGLVNELLSSHRSDRSFLG